jgi:hypothetical protein
VALRDVDRAERDAVPDRRRADEEPRVDDSSFEAAPSPDRADDLVAGISTSGTSSGPDWLPRRPERVPQRRLRLTLVASMTNTERSS